MSVPNQFETVEKRKHRRLYLPLNLSINNKKECNERQCDISEGGVSFRSTSLFKENDFVLFHFSGEEESEIDNLKFSILGRIIWLDKTNDDSYRYGAKFKFYNDPFSIQQHSIMASVINKFAS